eukprot:c34124_g1_i1 orf=36-332(-)
MAKINSDFISIQPLSCLRNITFLAPKSPPTIYLGILLQPWLELLSLILQLFTALKTKVPPGHTMQTETCILSLPFCFPMATPMLILLLFTALKTALDP